MLQSCHGDCTTGAHLPLLSLLLLMMLLMLLLMLLMLVLRRRRRRLSGGQGDSKPTNKRPRAPLDPDLFSLAPFIVDPAAVERYLPHKQTTCAVKRAMEVRGGAHASFLCPQPANTLVPLSPHLHQLEPLRVREAVVRDEVLVAEEQAATGAPPVPTRATDFLLPPKEANNSNQDEVC